METKFNNGDFGQCPRFACNGQNVLPVGLSDIPAESEVKVYCPRCNGVFETPLSRADGAFFGRTFAHFFLLTRKLAVPPMPEKVLALKPYEPTIFGYKISSESKFWNFGDKRGKGGEAAVSSSDTKAAKDGSMIIAGTQPSK
jgi:casein kinase II subunit beta